MLITCRFPIMRYINHPTSSVWLILYCTATYRILAFKVIRQTGYRWKLTMSCLIRNGVIWLLYPTPPSPNAFHRSTLCLVFLENGETHIRTIPQVRQWTHAKQVSHFIFFSITARETVGCAPASQRRKGQL